MTSTRRLITAISLSLASITLAARQPSQAEALFQRGLLLERAEGNLAQAVILYERVVAEYPKDLVVVPQALFHLARMYEKTDGQRATQMWSRLANEFGTTRYADEARRNLSARQAQASGPFRMRLLDSVLGDVPQNELYFAPDGRTASYVKDSQIFLRDLGTGKDRRVVSAPGHQLTDTYWSPDGSRMVFLIRDLRSGSGFQDRSHELRVLTIKTGEVRTLAKAANGLTFYSWSPDSQRVAMVLGWCCRGTTRETSTSGTVQVVNVVSGESRQVAGVKTAIEYDQLTWSPDSREFAFLTLDLQFAHGYRIVSVDSGQVRELPMPLPSGPQSRLSLAGGVFGGTAWAWKTNGQIVVRQGRGQGSDLYLVSPNGGSPKKTCEATRDQSACGPLTPDGSVQVVENTLTHKLTLLDVVTGVERRVSDNFGDEQQPKLSPDGKLLAFLSNADGKWGVYVVPIDKTPVAAPLRLAVLDERPDSIWSAAWSRDGRLVLSFNHATNNVYRINMDRSGRASGPAGRLTHDTDNNFTASVSPDSSRIAYWYVNGAKRGSAVMMADGSGEHPVAEGTRGPWRWASADEVLIYKPANGGSQPVLTALNVKTGAVRTLFEYQQGDTGYQFIPSRNEVVYWRKGATESERRLRARSLTDGSERALTTIDAFDMVLSPDGRQIAYGKWVGTGAGRRSELHLVNTDGTGDRILTSAPHRVGTWAAGGYPADWSHDGRFLLYDEYPGSNIGSLRVIDVRTGDSWPITETTNDESQRWFDAQWAPDGSFIVVSRNFDRTEYRAFEGVTYDAVVKLMNAPRK